MSLRFAVLPVLAALTIAAVSACQGQGEGGLCNPKAGNNGNDDCQSGLTCQIRPAVVTNSFGICCPPSGQSTTTSCSVNGPVIDANPAPPDASTGPTPTGEAGTAAPAEGAPEAGPQSSTPDATVE